jgi:hypothetical protein
MIKAPQKTVLLFVLAERYRLAFLWETSIPGI